MKQCPVCKSALVFANPEELLPHEEMAMVLDDVLFCPTCREKKILKQAFATSILELHPHIFNGHFPGNPICPGHWLEEMMLLTAACMIALGNPSLKKPMVVSVDGKKNLAMALPEDTVLFSVELVRERRRFFQFKGSATNQRNEPVMTIDKFTGVSA